MFTISKKFKFSASHQLRHLLATDPGHQCARLHGHNYEVEVVLASELLRDGFVRDYGDLRPFGHFLDTSLDHRHLVGIVGGTIVTVDSPEALVEVYNSGAQMLPATAENLARALFRFAKRDFPQVIAVRVSETPNTWATYTPDPGAHS